MGKPFVGAERRGGFPQFFGFIYVVFLLVFWHSAERVEVRLCRIVWFFGICFDILVLSSLVVWYPFWIIFLFFFFVLWRTYIFLCIMFC